MGVLYFLAAGRFHFSWGEAFDFKIGENIENLLVALIVARGLRRDIELSLLSRAAQSIVPGLGLLFVGLTLAAILHPSLETVEDILRLFGQLAVGALLAEWVVAKGSTNSTWYGAFLFGIVALLIRTPWGALDDPNLEGPFPHRNIQAAFCLLSVPLVLAPFLERRIRLDWKIVSGLAVLLVMGLFMILSRGRSGLIACLFVCGLILLKSVRFHRWGGKGTRLVLYAGALMGLLLVVGSLVPRFEDFGQEVFDPYRRSRIPIWAAAVEGWRDPTVLLFGIGMGDNFDRVLLETPQGNLNYRYRKAHYPHGLYLQWIYWGGMTALLGWLTLGFSVVRRLWGKEIALRRFLFGAFLTGYLILEIFESAFRDPRVAALFWMILFLFHGDPESEGEGTDG